MKKWGSILLCLLILPVALLAQEDPVERDAYFWGYYEFEFELPKDFVANFKNQIRLNENSTRFDYTAVDVGLLHKTARWLRLSVTYRYNLKNHLEDGWLNRHQIRGNISLRHKFENFKVYNRSRFQTGIEDAFGPNEGIGATDWFYRNRTRVKYYVNKRWDIYAYFEGYFRLGVKEPEEHYIYRTRFSVGANFEINSRESVRFFLVQDEQERGNRRSQRYFVGIGYNRTIDLD